MTIRHFAFLCLLLPDAADAQPQLTAPPGFVVECVAGPPLIERPMMAGFDERGRLFVCDSSGFNNLEGTSQDLIDNPPHMIRMLEDHDGDGRFDRSTIFADKMTFPMGALWHEGALYTASPPHVWRLEDVDGDGVADRREQFVARFDFGGNGCDIHGPFLGPDGRIYWANCQRGFDIPRPDGGRLIGKAAGLFRIRPDGRDVEIVTVGGMDNVVEVAFTAEGEAFATADLFIGYPRPRVDAIFHCIEGGVFPYRELDRSFARTGDVLPAMIDLGWVAPAGLMRYSDAALGQEYKENLFSAQFNTHRVMRHVLERDGATFRGKSEEFLSSSDPDFHPTDVLQDADGSLLVVDTGGWFLRGCPTSQIAKPDVKGAIYRIRRADVATREDPRGLQIPWESVSEQQLSTLLDDPRWVVRDRAIQFIASRGNNAIPELEAALVDGRSERHRRNAVWALSRIEGLGARRAVRGALIDSSDSVRLSAVTAAGLWRDGDALPILSQLAVGDAMPAVRREAATALGRIGSNEAISVLLDALQDGGDRFLEHARIYGLIQIGEDAALMPALTDSNPDVQRAALLALNQLPNANLQREQVIPLLDSTDAHLQRTALDVAIMHPEWADAVAKLLMDWLNRPELLERNHSALQRGLRALSTQPSIQGMIANAISNRTTPLASRLLLLDTIAQSPVETLPNCWLVALENSLEDSEERLAQSAVATLRARDETRLDQCLIRVSSNEMVAADIRLAALGIVGRRLPTLDPSLFTFVLSQLDAGQPVLSRLSAATALDALPLDREQLASLTQAVRAAGAVEMPYLLAPFARFAEPDLGHQLVAALSSSPGLIGLSETMLREALKAYPPDVQHAAVPLYAGLMGTTEQQSGRLKELEPVLSGGNAAQGRVLFFGPKASCGACHAVTGIGGSFGPDLSKIGSIRTPRDLLESVVFPSSSIVRTYEPYLIAMRDGRVHNGMMQQATADAVTLVITDRTVLRLPRTEIEQIQSSRVSIMPQGLDTQLTQQELGNLIAYLSSLK